MRQSDIKLHMSGRLLKKRGPAQIKEGQQITLDDLEALGANFKAMDAALIGPASANGYIPQHVLQTWLPGTIRALTAPIDIDLITGITTVGNWHDEEILVRTEEDFGKAELYGDTTNIPLANVNPGYERRQIQRFEQGFQVGKLEDARLGAAGFQVAEGKRRAATHSLDLARNKIGWRGMANTTTYGLLNDPNLAGVVAGGDWQAGTFDDLVDEFTAMRNALELQMGVSLRDDAQFLLLLPVGYRGIFNVYNASGNLNFGGWLRENYPNIRVEYSPELNEAGAGNLDLGYLIVENVADLDESTVDSATVIQAVPTRYNVLGSDNGIKGYIEDAVNATAGVIVLRPWAITRRSLSV